MATSALVATMVTGSASAAPGPAEIGQWTAPFEEGGAAEERCVPDPEGPDGQVICKPTAVNAGVLPDGRIWYSDGLTGTESWRYSSGELGTRLRNAQSRVLSLAAGSPTWTALTSGGSNSAIDPGSSVGDDLWGNLGVPGRPGDGRVGSLWGALGGPARNPSDPPDDPQANDLDFFCSDQAQLPDGRLLIAGGTDYYNEPRILDRDEGDPADLGFPEVEGLRATRIFDADTNTYRQVGDMKFARWYPTEVTLPDGRVSVFGGATKVAKNTQMSQVLRTETFDASTDTWTENYVGPASETSLPMVARVMLMPNGRILYTGVGQMWTPAGWAIDEALWGIQRSWDPATSTWTMHDLAPFGARNGAAQVLLPLEPPYDRGTAMDIGGTPFLPAPGSYVGTRITTLTTVDGAGAVTNARTGNLNHPRWYSSAVTLPTGEVLAVSGADRDAVITSGLERPIREAELYDPERGTWKRMASAARDRTYHNAAVLLPDGRVLVGGHAPFPLGAPPFATTAHDAAPGITANNDRDSSFEVFSPPYLFRGSRPAIGGVQRGVAWGQDFTIKSPDARSISQVVLSRLPSAQHVTDSDARTLRLSFTATNDAVTAVAPPASGPGASAVAPPGYYYLFVMKETPSGPVPSVARIVRLGAESDPSPTSPIFASNDPPPPDASIGATPDEVSSVLNPPPPPPGLGAGILGSGVLGLAIRPRSVRLASTCRPGRRSSRVVRS